MHPQLQYLPREMAITAILAALDRSGSAFLRPTAMYTAREAREAVDQALHAIDSGELAFHLANSRAWVNRQAGPVEDRLEQARRLR